MQVRESSLRLSKMRFQLLGLGLLRVEVVTLAGENASPLDLERQTQASSILAVGG